MAKRKPEKSELRSVIDKRLIKQVQIIASLLEISQSDLVAQVLQEYLPEKYAELFEKYNLDKVNGDD
jgi:lambda repressor-like predicted transcriptional regulator